jgi:hypothetical protein
MPVFADLPHVVMLNGYTYIAPEDFRPIEEFLQSEEASGYHHEFWVEPEPNPNRVVVIHDRYVYFAFSDVATAVALKMKFG